MPYLLIVTILWAFSFPLIHRELSGINPYFLALVRLFLATLVFLPSLRIPACTRLRGLVLLGLGAVQFGLMYSLLFQAFQFLSGHQVALFTVLTPLYVFLLGRWGGGRLRWSDLLWVAAAVSGAAIIRMHIPPGDPAWEGFLFVQGANLCFAFGQVTYRRLRRAADSSPARNEFALIYLGGCLFALIAWIGPGGGILPEVTWRQAGVLLYLGVVASGLCFFWWNVGAATVRSVTLLAVMNNAMIPLTVVVAVLLFGEVARWDFLIWGGALVLASIAGATLQRPVANP